MYYHFTNSDLYNWLRAHKFIYECGKWHYDDISLKVWHYDENTHLMTIDGTTRNYTFIEIVGLLEEKLQNKILRTV